MSTTDVEALRGELGKLKERSDRNAPRSGSTASLRTGAGGRIESVLIRFARPVDQAHGDDIVASLESWADDIHGDATADPEAA